MFTSRVCFSSFPYASPFLFVQGTTKALQNKAQVFAKKHGLQVLGERSEIPHGEDVILLKFTPERVQYVQFEQKKKKMKEKCSLSCDFDDNALLSRVKAQTAVKSPLLKALGVSPADSEDEPKLFIVDATAGLGEDSFLMAHFASRVLMIERSPLLHVLLDDGLQRMKESNNYMARMCCNRMELYAETIDSISVLEKFAEYHISHRPDIIFLDPMHEEKYTKSALPKLKIQLARKLVGRGNEEEHQKLLEKAKQAVKQRVIFKKPFNSPTDSKANFSVTGGRAVRYDIYVNPQ